MTLKLAFLSLHSNRPPNSFSTDLHYDLRMYSYSHAYVNVPPPAHKVGHGPMKRFSFFNVLTCHTPHSTVTLEANGLDAGTSIADLAGQDYWCKIKEDSLEVHFRAQQSLMYQNLTGELLEYLARILCLRHYLITCCANHCHTRT